VQSFAAQTKELLPQIAAKKIFGKIKGEMALVEEEFERQAASNIQVISFLGDYLRASGGKRVRPALLVLSAYAVGGHGSDDNVIRLATVMEMLHTATLVHDDIIDNADTRRSRPSVNARFGNHAAVLMGDWLYMSAFEASLKERSLPILDILTKLTRKMTEGEIIQLTTVGDSGIAREEYFDILRRKTAYLFSGCCEIGAIVGGADPARQAALRDYGMNLGIAFQLADDLLDFTADEATLGKASGADLLEGKLTLPLILLAERDGGVREMLEEVMDTGEYQNGQREEINEQLIASGAMNDARELADSYAIAARKSLEVLPKTEYLQALDEIPGYVIARSN
jgi:octaprenyl-diphosphate synthase